MRGIAAREVDRDCVIERLCSRAAEDFPALSRNIIMESLYIQLLSKTQYL